MVSHAPTVFGSFFLRFFCVGLVRLGSFEKNFGLRAPPPLIYSSLLAFLWFCSPLLCSAFIIASWPLFPKKLVFFFFGLFVKFLLPVYWYRRTWRYLEWPNPWSHRRRQGHRHRSTKDRWNDRKVHDTTWSISNVEVALDIDIDDDQGATAPKILEGSSVVDLIDLGS